MQAPMFCCCQNHSIVEMDAILSMSFHRSPDGVSIRYDRLDRSQRIQDRWPVRRARRGRKFVQKRGREFREWLEPHRV